MFGQDWQIYGSSCFFSEKKGNEIIQINAQCFRIKPLHKNI